MNVSIVFVSSLYLSRTLLYTDRHISNNNSGCRVTAGSKETAEPAAWRPGEDVPDGSSGGGAEVL